MSLLPTATDVILTIAALSEDVIVRRHNLSSGIVVECNPTFIVNSLNVYGVEVLNVNQKTITIRTASTDGCKHTYELTFFKKVMTQIGIEAL